MVVGGNQSGKGAKGLLMGKGAAAAAAAAAAVDDKKDKKKPTSRSSRAGLQVCPLQIYLKFHHSTLSLAFNSTIWSEKSCSYEAFSPLLPSLFLSPS